MVPILTKTAEVVRRAIIQLRPYQHVAEQEIHQQWSLGYKNVLAVLPTGSGKTVLLSKIIHDHNGPSCTIAHRQELVSQISIALARNGIRHRIIGPDKLIRMIVSMQMIDVGMSFYDPSAMAAVAGVDTIMSWLGTGVDGDTYVQTRPDNTLWQYERFKGCWSTPYQVDVTPMGSLKGKLPPKSITEKLSRYAPTVTLWVTDEAHHCAAVGGKRNKWMKATDLFTNAKGLGVTATPCRADGAGLGSHHDGVFDTMVIGPTMRDLINDGFLTEYRVFAPPSDLSTLMDDVSVSKSTHDYNVNEVRDAVENSSLIVSEDKTKVTGDVVDFYLKKFKGMLSVVFVPSVAAAETLEAQFIKAGIPAKSLNGNTPDQIRSGSIRKFAKRELLVLINVALFDEGFDLPAIEVVQDAYPTKSYGLFCQRFGRMLRLMEGKKFGIYSDHASNVARHGLPDAPKVWTLDRREKRSSDDDVEAVRTCMNEECYSVYPRYLTVCPHCKTEVIKPTPAERADVEFVDGDLYELDEQTLAAMRGEVAKVDAPLQESIQNYRAELVAKHVPTIGVMGHVKRFAVKMENQQEAVASLRECMAIWAGHHRANGSSDSEIFRRFYLKFAIDWLSAQALDSDKLYTLGERVTLDIGKL